MIISGLVREIIWDKETIECWVREKLEVEVKVLEVWRTGKEKKKIVEEYGSRGDKERIMETKKRLGAHRVFIDNDLTWKKRRTKERILEKARELKAKGMRVKIGYNKVSSEKEDWIWSEREKKWFQKEKERGGEEES